MTRKKKIAIIVIIPFLLLILLSLLPIRRPGPAIGIIRIEEAIRESRRIVERLNEARENPLIRGVVIYINTPGGGVVACQEIVDAIDRLQDDGKIVVASLGPIAASGGYYIASSADKIVANPGTLTGSISVIMQLPYMEKLIEKIGIEMRVIKSGRYKDIASPFREMKEDERELLQDLIDDLYNQFLDEIVKGRGIDRDSLIKIADGRVFTGRKAKELGLVDTLGTLYDAKAIAGELAGIERPRLIEMKVRREPLLRRLLSSFTERKSVRLDYLYIP